MSLFWTSYRTKGCPAFRELFREWFPLGQPARDLVFIAGPPTRSFPGRLVYSYRASPLVDAYWSFSIKDGIIQSVDSGGSD